jgi:hypothetical protein
MDDGLPVAVDGGAGRVAAARNVPGCQQALLMQTLPHSALIHQESDALITRHPLRHRERNAGLEQQRPIASEPADLLASRAPVVKSEASTPAARILRLLIGLSVRQVRVTAAYRGLQKLSELLGGLLRGLMLGLRGRCVYQRLPACIPKLAGAGISDGTDLGRKLQERLHAKGQARDDVGSAGMCPHSDGP